MKIVHSLWSAPRPMSVDHRMLMSLSVLLARQHYDQIELVTDNAGALLARHMDIPYTRIRTDLEGLDAPKGAWAAGKLRAYEVQEEPFLHIDHDVFLFQRLPALAHTSGLVAQSFEGADLYRRALPTMTQEQLSELVLPPDRWAAYNAGVLGGTDLPFLRDYAGRALAAIRRAPKVLPSEMIVYEQAFFARHAADLGKQVHVVLEEVDEADEIGYCHLMCAKASKTCMQRVRQRLQSMDSRRYTLAVLATR